MGVGGFKDGVTSTTEPSHLSLKVREKVLSELVCALLHGVEGSEITKTCILPVRTEGSLLKQMFLPSRRNTAILSCFHGMSLKHRLVESSLEWPSLLREGSCNVAKPTAESP